jgi:hypothetical protein
MAREDRTTPTAKQYILKALQHTNIQSNQIKNFRGDPRAATEDLAQSANMASPAKFEYVCIRSILNVQS